jgi:predicted lipoprotein with Yx(FWY)xxD motif
MNGTVSLRTTKLGPILVDSRGHTVYLFAKDRNGKSVCSSSCSMFWPPLITAGKPTAGAGVNASLLGTSRRSSGKLQVTYNKHPLYTFLLDKRATQTNGEGNLAFGARWYAVSARGTAVIKAAASTTTSTTSGTTTPTTTYCLYPPC